MYIIAKIYDLRTKYGILIKEVFLCIQDITLQSGQAAQDS